MDRFLRGPPKRTDAIQTACVEICESKYDRLLLSVIDTPGLDFQEGHELKLERQVSTIVKYLDSQFADTLSEVRGYRRSQLCRVAPAASRCVPCERRPVSGFLGTDVLCRNQRSSVKARATNTFICTCQIRF